MKKCFLCLIMFCALCVMSFSQNIGIGTANPLNKLHVAGGLRLDTLTTVDGSGLLKHDVNGVVHGIKFSGNVNDVLRGDGTFGSGSNNAVWFLNGNAGIDAANNFIGTTDAQPLLFRVSNYQSGLIHPTNSNTAFGFQTLVSNTTGNRNTANGYRSLYSNTSGLGNTAYGSESLNMNTDGTYNTAVGYQSQNFSTSGSYNTAYGYQSMHNNSGGTGNTAIGSSSLRSSTNGSYNTAIGTASMWLNTSGFENTANGYQSLYSNTSGFYNTTIGTRSMQGNTTGNLNTANGYESLQGNTTGNLNTANGASSLGSNTTGLYNVGIGALTLYSTAASSYNTAIGYNAGNNYNFGSDNTFLGANAAGSAAGLFNCIAIGKDATCTANNEVRIGNSSTASLFCYGAYASTSSASANMVINSSGQIMRSTSSARYKSSIQDLDINTENIYQLRPRSYTSINDGQKYFGLVAEEVNKVLPELVEYAKEKDVIAGSESEEMVPDAVRYPMLAVLLLKEEQKQKTKIEDQQKQIDELISIVQSLKKKLN